MFVHVDDTLLVLDKPAGLLAVPGRGPDKQDCLSARVQARYADALIVHRLDMDTSGLLCMARGIAAQRTLSAAFAARAVSKRYIAVVHGHPCGADDWNVIDQPLIIDWPNRPKSKVDHAIGKPSVTRWRLLAHDESTHTSRVELEPVTGRSHQLRVHLQFIGHPIVGDPLYGPEHAAERMYLHACALTLPHPTRGGTVSFSSTPEF